MGEILLLNDSFPPAIDGVANTVVNYADVMAKAGKPVAVATPEWPDADDSGFPYPVLRFPSFDTRQLVGYTTGNPFDVSTVMELRRRDISLLHSHCPVTSMLLARALREGVDAPLVLTYHTKFDIEIAKAFKGKMLQAGVISALVENVTAADELWVVSAGAGENIRSMGYQGDYVVMQNGVDLPKQRASEGRIHLVTDRYNLPAGVPCFLFVGRMMWYKGIRLILDALAALKSADLDFRMVFIGDGADRPEIRDYAAALRLDDKVVFVGPVADRDSLAAWYTRADLLLFPSTFDTYGLVVREAAACGTGSVLVRGSSAADGVTDGLDGLLADNNAASLAVRLARVMDDRDGLRALGERASDRLYLSWDDAVHRAMERYEVVLDTYKSGGYAKRRSLASDLFTLSGDMLDMMDSASRIRKDLDRYL